MTNEGMTSLTTNDDIVLGVHDDGVAVLQMCRPPNNFFDTTLLGRVADALEFVDDDDRCRVVVLGSQGRHFCAGAALGQGRDAGREPDGRHLYEEAARIFRCRTPIVAAVQGAAIGGGLGLAMAADFRVAAESARLAANFAALGFHHGFALTETLPRAIGTQQATRVLLEARRLTGAEAAQIGMVDAVVPNDELMDATHELAARIAANAPLAIRSIRETMRGDLADRAVTAMVRERREQERLSATNDFAEGVVAMAARRPPLFRGT
jgi:2-(1,2-epoxy-1,2-dihydrophenyl)acetyl-CoA isomerase